MRGGTAQQIALRGAAVRGAGTRRLAPRGVLAAAVLIFCATIAYGFSFTPISRDFAPSGDGATQTFRVDNPGNTTIAVKISMVTRTMNEDGTETNTDASDQFIVFPSRLVVRPGQSQAVRVQWKGPADIKSERAFRIIADQVPVDFENAQQQDTGSIRIMFRYLGAVYIVPPGAAPDIEVASCKPAKDKKGASGLDLVLDNKGTAHTILTKPKLTLTYPDAKGAQHELTLSDDQLSTVAGENILAGATRQFFVPLPGNADATSKDKASSDQPTPTLPDTGLDAHFTYEPAR